MKPKESIYKRNRQKLIDDHIDENGYLFCTCGDCGGRSNTNGKFEVHHIIWRSEATYSDHLHDIENLISVFENSFISILSSPQMSYSGG